MGVSSFQFLDKVYINGTQIETATGYDTVAEAIENALPAPRPSSTLTISYTTFSAIDSSGTETGTLAYNNFNVYESADAALAFTESAGANGGAEKTFSGVADGGYLMIATENYGAAQYYAYRFKLLVVFMPRIFEPPVVKWVSVTITGTGDADKLYAIINGTTYYQATSNIETLAGSEITFGLKSASGNDVNTYPTFLEIDGVETSSATVGKQTSYTVPDSVSAITIQLTYWSDTNSRITVTTS